MLTTKSAANIDENLTDSMIYAIFYFFFFFKQLPIKWKFKTRQHYMLKQVTIFFCQQQTQFGERLKHMVYIQYDRSLFIANNYIT